MMRMTSIASLLFALVGPGCGAGTNHDASSVTNGVRSFDAKGVIKAIPAGGGALVIAHEEIPGFMPPMTMELKVRDAAETRNLMAGDEVTFQLFSTEETHWIANITRVGKQPVAPPALNPRDAAELKLGDSMPDHELLAESGQPIKLSDYRGKALAFTFIFTRCPISDYCPRMSKNLARAHELMSQPDAPANWHLLSISFDPDYDRPEVLKRYAEAYRDGADRNWTFAAASGETLAKLAPEVDLMLTREAGGNIGHNLRTVVVDPQGRVHRQFDGNEWTGDDLAAAMAEAARVVGERR